MSAELSAYFDWVNEQPQPEHFDMQADRISFWKYEMFKQCPLKFKRIVLDKDPVPQDSRNAFEGLVLHAVMDEYIKSGALESPEMLVAKLFESTVTDAKTLIWKTTPPDKDKGAAYRAIEKMVEWSIQYLKETGILLHPTVGTETPFQSKVHPGLMVSGRIDLWTKDAANKVKVYDWKTVKDASPKKTQMLFYVLGLFAEVHEFAQAGYFVCPRVKTVVDLDFSVVEILEFIDELKEVQI